MKRTAFAALAATSMLVAGCASNGLSAVEPSGTPWSAPAQIPATNPVAGSLAFATKGSESTDDVAAVWLTGPAGQRAVQASWWSPGTGWAMPETLSAATDDASDAQIAGVSGGVAVTWLANDAGYRRVRERTSDNYGGRTWLGRLR